MTEWLLPFPRERVWRLIRDVEQWPLWWPMVKRVEPLQPGDAQGIGAVRRFTWRTALPYEVAMEMRVERLEPLHCIEGRSTGDLDGTGLWTLWDTPHGTRVQYNWTVVLRKRWMRWLAPLLRRVFAWNHDKVMETGRLGILRALRGQL